MRWLVGLGLVIGALASSGGCATEDAPPALGDAGSGGTNDGCPPEPEPTSCSSEPTICPLGAQPCPLTRDAVLNPVTWEATTWWAILDECEGGVVHLGLSYFEAGYSVVFDAEGMLVYVSEEPCHRVLCGERPELRACQSCKLGPVSARPTAGGSAGGGGEGGEGPLLGVPPACEVDDGGRLRVPRR